MKKIISGLLLTAIFSSLAFAEGESCKYTSEIERCKKANWLLGSPWSTNPKKIKDFTCIYVNNDNIDYMIYQIVLDKKFKEIDERVEKYLEYLESQKQATASSEESMFEITSDVAKKFKIWWVFWTQYYWVCDAKNENSAMKETVACFDNKDGSSSSPLLKRVFTDDDPTDETNSPCVELTKTKLGIYEKVAYNILKVNKWQTRRDNRASRRKTHRERYDKLFELVRICLRYIDSIARKWPSKERNPKQP